MLATYTMNEKIKKAEIIIQPVKNNKFEIYKNNKYLGTYGKGVTNIKLRCWNLPEII